jgi:hypothetical protein
MKIIIAFTITTAAILLSATGHAAPYTWGAASGLFPDQVSVAMALTDSSSPESPQLAGGFLTIANDTDSEFMYYDMQGSDIAMPAHLTITASVLFVAGNTSNSARTSALIGFATMPGIGNGVYIGQNEIFLSSAEATRGPSASLDTSSFSHLYRIEVFGLAIGSTIQVFQDDVLQLTGNLYSSIPDNGSTESVSFGDRTSLASGNSQWQSFNHNAAVVPEPSTLYLGAISGLFFLYRKCRNRTRGSR